MNEEDFLLEENENIGFGIIDVQENSDQSNIPYENVENIENCKNTNTIGGNANTDIVTSVLYLIMAVICISLRDTSSILPMIGICILLISVFKNANEFKLDIFFLIIPSMISLVSAYVITFTARAVSGILLLTICCISLILLKFYSLDIKIHFVLIFLQFVFSAYMIYSYTKDINGKKKTVIEKFKRIDTLGLF